MMLSISLKRFYTVFMMMTVTVAASLVLVPGSSLAGDPVCVVCTNPDLTYRCKVLRDDGTLATKGFEYHCMKEIARAGAHQSCSVKRLTDGVCEGLQKTLVYNGPAPKAPRNSSFEHSPGSGLDPNAPVQGHDVARDKNGQPRTLIEFTDQTVKSTKKGLKNTGAAIGGAAKKTGDTVVGVVKKSGQAVGGAAKKTGDTVVGAVKSTGGAVGGAVKKTGQAIGKAGKSTLNCVTSFFTDCF